MNTFLPCNAPRRAAALVAATIPGASPGATRLVAPGQATIAVPAAPSALPQCART